MRKVAKLTAILKVRVDASVLQYFQTTPPPPSPILCELAHEKVKECKTFIIQINTYSNSEILTTIRILVI